MAITFSNVSVLSASSRSDFFAEQVRFKSTLELSIEGYFLNLTNDNTHATIHNLLNAYELESFGNNEEFYDTIVINTVNFGRGYITNFRTDADGTDVNSKKYTITITIPIDGDTSILSDGLTFNGLSFTDFKYIQSFSESSTYTRGEGFKDSYSQNVSVTILPESKSTGKQKASSIIQNFLSNNNLTSLINGTYQKTDIRKRYDQTYDEITNTYTVNCNWIIYPRSLDGTGGSANDNVIVIRNVTVNYDPDGTINVTEEGQCTGNQNASNQLRFESAAAKARNLISSAYGRLSSYIDTAKHGNLINHPISKNFTSIIFEGRATYSVTYTNSKEVIASNGYWSFTNTINLTEGGDYTGSESGEITGKNELLTNKQKYTLALNHWNNIKNTIKNRINSHISSVQLQEITSSQTHSEIEGRISYNYSFSSNGSISTTQQITKEITSVTEDYNRNLYSTFNIVGRKEIAQIQTNLLPNEVKVNVTLNGKYTTPLNTFLSRAKNIANQYQRGQITDVNYSYSPSNREFNLNVTYFYMP